MEIDLLIKLIQKESITPNECGIYEIIKDILYDFKYIEQENFGVKNIFLYKDFSKALNLQDKNKVHLCFAGHIDVVPSGDNWKHPPFSGIIENNLIYGRGAQDMKGGVASFIAAIRDIKEFNGIISVLLTSDEECDGTYGTKFMLEELKNINFLPNFAVVAEPTSSNTLCDNIKIGRRGSINGVLKIYGKQGHVAYPNKCINPLDLLAPILPKLTSAKLDNGDNNFDESKIIISNINGGIGVENMTPDKITIMFNVRNSPLSNQDSIKTYIKELMKDLKYDLNLSQNAKPFITESRILIDNMSEAINKTLFIEPLLSTSGGTSDARFFNEFGVDSIEVGHINNKIHSIDECVSINDVSKLKEVFINFINTFK